MEWIDRERQTDDWNEEATLFNLRVQSFSLSFDRIGLSLARLDPNLYYYTYSYWLCCALFFFPSSVLNSMGAGRQTDGRTGLTSTRTYVKQQKFKRFKQTSLRRREQRIKPFSDLATVTKILRRWLRGSSSSRCRSFCSNLFSKKIPGQLFFTIQI